LKEKFGDAISQLEKGPQKFDTSALGDIAKKYGIDTFSDINDLQEQINKKFEQNSDKLIKTGFKPKFSVEDAIKEFREKYLNHEILINEKCNNVKWMKKLGLNNG